MTDSFIYPVFPGLGVLTSDNPEIQPRLVQSVRANDSKTAVELVNDTGRDEQHEASSININAKTGRLDFVSDDNTYRVREPRENDGLWLSKFKIDLPVRALRAFAPLGEKMPVQDETLEAFATEDSPYIVGLVYSNGVGQWSRVDGDWVLLSPTDSTFNGGEAYEIDNERADEFIEMYDNHYVSIIDAEQYESAGAALDETPEAEQTSDE